MDNCKSGHLIGWSITQTLKPYQKVFVCKICEKKFLSFAGE